MKKSDVKEEFSVIDRLHPVKSVIKERYPLTQFGSTKHTYHISLDFADAPIQFKVGDSIGIYPQNDPRLVQHLIEAMKARKGREHPGSAQRCNHHFMGVLKFQGQSFSTHNFFS